MSYFLWTWETGLSTGSPWSAETATLPNVVSSLEWDLSEWIPPLPRLLLPLFQKCISSRHLVHVCSKGRAFWVCLTPANLPPPPSAEIYLYTPESLRYTPQGSQPLFYIPASVNTIRSNIHVLQTVVNIKKLSICQVYRLLFVFASMLSLTMEWILVRRTGLALSKSLIPGLVAVPWWNPRVCSQVT